jgi:predicted small integral membrane protein
MDLGIGDRLGKLVQSMYWTQPTAIFFVCIGLMLVVMTSLQLVWPTVERRGLLPMATTRGDRLFIGLLGAAWIHLAWLGFSEQPLWQGSGVAFLWLVLVMRFG